MRSAPLQRSLGLVLWCALVAAIILMSLGERRVDLWWQLSQGLSILSTHHLPAEAPAAFGLPSRPFIDEYGLYEIGLAGLEKVGGLGAIHLAFTSVYLSIFALPLLAARSVRCDWISAALLALAGIFLVNRYEQRPELIGVLLLVMLLVLLHRTRDFSPGLLLRIALLFAVWTNVHSSYVIGLLALAIWLADRLWFVEPAAHWRPAHAATTLALGVGALLINPYGARRIVFTFEQETDLGSNLLSREMWPVWDQPPGVVALMLVTAALLVAIFTARPRPSLWLRALAGALFLLTVWHVRHMSFLAVPLLFLYADRKSAAPSSPRWTPLAVVVLAAGCVAVLLFDSVAVRNAWGDLTAGDAKRNRGFAPGLLEGQHYSAILCHDAEGSYLEYRIAGMFPLIDSGQGRFDDDTKRFYFFTVENPDAFARALDLLPDAEDVVVTPPVEGWALWMIQRPGWFLTASEPKGLLFRRFQGSHPPAPRGGLDEAAIVRLRKFRDQSLREGDRVRAFCFSAMADPPPESLALLDRSEVHAWSEAFFSFARDWIRALPHNDIAAFLQAHPQPANALLREILLARTAPTRPLPPPGHSALERLARVLTLLERNDGPGARTLFATLPLPKVSPLYYTLRASFDPVAARQAPAAERWQDWNTGGEALFDRLGPVLDKRAHDRVETTGIR